MKKNAKRILAWIGIILLVGMYVATFIVSLVDKSSGGQMIVACLCATVIIPVSLWAVTIALGIGKNAKKEFEKIGEDPEQQ